MVLGFFNPRASLFWYSKERTTGLSSFIYGILLVLFIYMVPANKENAIETALHSQTIAADTVEAKMDTNTTVPTRVVEDPAKIEGERILRKLKARAERDWPNDYTTQEYWISNELEDYRYMLTIADGPIKRQAERDWPYDYTTQKYWYDQQIEARERLNR
ncbi:MAG: hypothetical protein JWR38_5265 [Mucilaginibacter sp.]|nr:hypothetical protein [Mucilaginibacter sp.]